MAEKIEEEIKKLIKPIIGEAGYRLFDMKWSGRDLTVTIDKEKGVSVEDCARVSRLIDPIIEEANLISKNYRLIVSSPGIK